MCFATGSHGTAAHLRTRWTVDACPYDAAVPVWDPHKLAGELPPEIDLTPGQRVRNKVELPRVPAGTDGRVLLADGFAWRRYRVLFDNGIEVGFLDGRHLEAGKKSLLQRLRPKRR
jgi:hypothetical protein